MEGMLAAVMEELKGLRTNPAELKRCLQTMKQDCSTRQTEILHKLSEVEAIVDANHDVSLVDLAGIEEVLYNSLSLFMMVLNSNNKSKCIACLIHTILFSLSLFYLCLSLPLSPSSISFSLFLSLFPFFSLSLSFQCLSNSMLTISLLFAQLLQQP
jgi:hypothetical protein